MKQISINVKVLVSVAIGVLIAGTFIFLGYEVVHQFDALKNQTAANTANIQTIADFLNKAIANQQQAAPAPAPTSSPVKK